MSNFFEKIGNFLPQFSVIFFYLFLFPVTYILRLTDLLFDMQQYGQPPAEIMKDLAPGLKFDEEGMPIMPNMGGHGMPSTSLYSKEHSLIPNRHLKCFVPTLNVILFCIISCTVDSISF